MALRFLEGFDAMATADLASRFTSANASTSVVAAGRNGGNCLRMSNFNQAVTINIPANATVVAGCAITMRESTTGNRGIIALFDNTVTHITLAVGSDGVLRVYRGTVSGTLLATGTTALGLNTWYYVELYITIHDTAGVVKLQVNGAAESLTFVTGTSTTQDTRNAGNATVNQISIPDGTSNSTAGEPDVDDIYILDGDSADADNPNNDFLGDLRVESLLPSGAGDDADFTPSAGSNYQNVDDSTPDGDTTYNSSATTNHTDTFAMGNLASSGSVAGIEILNYAKKTDAGSALIAGVIKPGSTKYAGTDRAPSTSYRYASNIWDVNPDTGVAFTASEINSLKAGYKKTG